MRRKDREITGRENIEPVLQACKTCRLAMTADGMPYVIPLNFGYTWDETGLTIYFHSGVKGKKIDALRADPRVCFEMDTEMGLTGEGDLACRYSFAFASVVGYGSIQFAQNNEEKRRGFDIIMQHQDVYKRQIPVSEIAQANDRVRDTSAVGVITDSHVMNTLLRLRCV